MASTKVRALVFDKAGKPNEVLKLAEVDLPKQVGPTEVLLRMMAAAIHPSDFLYVEGTYLQPAKPGRAGAEGVGIVEAVGSNVKDVKTGERLAVWTESYQTGTWGEYFVFDTRVCRLYTSVPDDIPDEVAAQLILNPLTLLGMLSEMQDAGLKKGDWFLQTAASSSLGRMMIQVAKLKGFKTFNTVRREAQIKELQSLGGDAVVVQDTLPDSVKEITKGQVRHGIDPVGGKLTGKLLDSLGENGLLLLYGFLSGQEIQFYPMSMIGRQLALKGFYISLFAKTHEDKVKPMLSEIIDVARSGKVKFPAKTFDFQDFKKAIEHSTSQSKAEKTVLMFNAGRSKTK